MAVDRLRKLSAWVIVLLFFSVIAAPVQASAASSGKAGAARFERALGGGAVPEILKQYGGEYVLPLGQRLWVEEVFRRLVGAAERQDVEYTLTVLNSAELNAFALPGGYVFITRGLVNAIGRDEAKLAAVLGHEIAHIEEKHGMNAVLRQMGLTVLLEVGMLAVDFASADLLRLAGTTLLELISRGWGREAEFEADLVGQTLAVRAGFDGSGAVSLLDGVLNLDSEDLPMKVFRTHPDTQERRERLEANLASFWPPPAAVDDPQVLERLNGGRILAQAGRNDPRGRYIVSLQENGAGLHIFDLQLGESALWLEGASVRDFAWSPQGQYLAVTLDEVSGDAVWICDRWGHVKRQIDLGRRRASQLSWSPEGKQLALLISDSGSQGILVTYAEADALVPMAADLGVEYSTWLEDGLFIFTGDAWYCISPPPVVPVTVQNPVPQVLQRQRILSPTVIKEGSTIRLTRPSLTMP
ncbi:MAG: M48 family metalloprotease [Bacillota bacterium]|nr:M48 family metalloprotease [Bacillota bacterium]NLJ02509.1 M48 family metalloprotease [Bacillota bacterium]